MCQYIRAEMIHRFIDKLADSFDNFDNTVIILIIV